MLRAALVLGLLSAVGPFAIDMYLPAMPSIAIALNADISSVQFTLTAYFLSFGAAQLFYGPWSDQMGRKVPLYVGIGVFIVASIGCAMAPTIGWLVAFRALQGAGGAALMVLPRAVIRDMHTGTQATKLLAMVILVISVSPMLAPLVGSGLIVIGEWRLIFWALCLVAALSLLLTVTALPETLSPNERVPVNLGNFMRGCSTLIKDPIFMGLTFIGGFGVLRGRPTDKAAEWQVGYLNCHVNVIGHPAVCVYPAAISLNTSRQQAHPATPIEVTEEMPWRPFTLRMT
jgi:DHA1 family bicyclomycin/chloramphenicol resistance-like MFS transporter